MAQVIKPSVGRQLLYYPGRNDNFDLRWSPLAATICWVHADRLVNVVVLSHEGQAAAHKDVLLVQPDDPLPEATISYCAWPAFQVSARRMVEDAATARADAAHKVQQKTPDVVPSGV